MNLQRTDAEHEKASKILGLTHKEREFALEYIKNGGKTEEAALKAGYAPSTAKSKCYQIINKPEVKAFMRETINAALADERMEVNEILARAARIARIDPRAYFNEDGSVKSPTELTEQQAFALRAFEVSVEEFGSGENAKFKETKKIKLADPLPALRMLAQIAQLLQPDVGQLNVFIDLDARMDKARSRLQNRAVEDAKIVDKSVVSDQ